ncbi:protein of unknown function [Methylocaldum szegediense]|uniref:Uncharacterized protein n=1 Tax=Methylocaldum szegediense TaxID=73780 RepID=A0ABM9I787_9GAMM|nr:protein of unknown function [Methylocaldum szegediense]
MSGALTGIARVTKANTMPDGYGNLGLKIRIRLPTDTPRILKGTEGEIAADRSKNADLQVGGGMSEASIDFLSKIYLTNGYSRIQTENDQEAP